MTDFQQKLFLILLDKGVLAVTALLIGYWISKHLERYRADQQRMSALERDKVVLENELDKLKRTRQIEFKEKQLSQFYWPIHFRFAKDSAIWKIVPQLSDQVTTVPDKVGREIEANHLVRNHEEIVSLMEANIHLAEPDAELLREIAAYVRHVAVYSALRSTKTYDLNPIDVGEPFPEQLVASLETRLKKLQSEYEALVLPHT